MRALILTYNLAWHKLPYRQLMPFSWKKLIFGPLPAPMLFAVLFTGSTDPDKWLFSFVFFFSLASIISYATTVLLFVPTLFCVSRFIALRFTHVALIGFVLGLAVFLPLTYAAWLSSGPDSGPPVGSYWRWVTTDWTILTACCLPVSGLVTATAFWFIGGRSFINASGLQPA